MEDKIVFVTVGTTQFNELVERVTQKDVLKVLSSRGYKRLLLQIGQGSYEPKIGLDEGIFVDFYRLKNSLVEDIKEADLVISHGGAGCCTEVLDARKPLVVVINENLMHNHQAELANALQSRSHAISCTPAGLLPSLKAMDLSQLVPYPKAVPESFVSFLHDIYKINK